MSKDISCLIPGLLEFSGKFHNVRECDDVTEGSETVGKLSDVIASFIKNPENFGCPLPCQRNYYSYSLNHVHENAITIELPKQDEGRKYCYFNLYYSTFLIEQQVETLIYDLGGFLAAAGGNLGLCLGFSCLSVLLTLSQWWTRGYQWIKHQIN